MNGNQSDAVCLPVSGFKISMTYRVWRERLGLKGSIGVKVSRFALPIPASYMTEMLVD